MPRLELIQRLEPTPSPRADGRLARKRTLVEAIRTESFQIDQSRFAGLISHLLRRGRRRATDARFRIRLRHSVIIKLVLYRRSLSNVWRRHEFRNDA